MTDERRHTYWDCPDAEVCKRCPCAGDDDVCFPGERLRAELSSLQTALAEAEKGCEGLAAIAAEQGRLKAAANGRARKLREALEEISLTATSRPDFHDTVKRIARKALEEND